MVEINIAQFTDAAESNVYVRLSDGREVFLDWPGTTNKHRKLEAWVAAGGVLAPYEKSERELKAEMDAEAGRRIAAQVAAWDSERALDFLVSIQNLLDWASASAAQLMARDLYVYAKQSRSKIDGLMPAEVALVVATDDLPFAAVDGADLGWPDTRP